MRTPEDWKAFAVATPGLEQLVAGELRSLGIPVARVVEGGVEFAADLEALYRANLHLRTASRVIVRLASFRATSFAELERRARSVRWERVLPHGAAVAIRVTCRKSRLYHSDAVAERLMRDLVDRRSARPLSVPSMKAGAGDDEGGAGQLFVVRFDRDECTISADSSGTHLHRRRYRTAVGEAPMRETLAAALVLASDWNGEAPLMDPFCGSGTIPIEAAMIAARLAPGRGRSFRFADWPGHDERTWTRVRRAATLLEVAAPAVTITGSDRSSAAIRSASANADRAGVSHLVRFERTDARDASPRSSVQGWIVTNPPYGVRLGDARERLDLLAAFGVVLRERFRGWHVALLSPDSAVRSTMGFPLDDDMRTSNGGLAVRFYRGDVPAVATTSPANSPRRNPVGP